MIYKFRLISGEVDDFIREISVDGAESFLTLHNFMQQELGYDPSQMASFFTTDQNWHKETEITLLDMMGGENPDLAVMDKACVADFVLSAKQRMLYVFDFFNERAFFMEVFGIEDGKLDDPICDRREGLPPTQIEMGNMETDAPFMDEFEMEEELDDFFTNQDDIENDSDLESLGLDIYSKDY